MADVEAVFEMVDATDDEMYFPLGVWLTLEDAMAALDECKEPSDLGSERGDTEGYCKVEIRRHGIGWGGTGKVLDKGPSIVPRDAVMLERGVTEWLDGGEP